MGAMDGKLGVLGSVRPVSAALMLSAAGAFSFAPVVVVWGAGWSNYFIFICWWRCGVALGSLLFLVLWSSRAGVTREMLGLAVGQLRSRWFALTVLGGMTFVVFAMAVALVGPAVAGVVMGITPMLHAVVLKQVFGDEDRYSGLKVINIVLLALAFGGTVLVGVSQWWGVDLSVSSMPKLALGGLLSLMAAGLGVTESASNLKWGVGTQRSVGVEGGGPASELFWVVFGMGAAAVLSGIVCAAIGLSLGQEFDAEQMSIGLLAGGLGQAVGSICLRAALLVSKDLFVNGLSYLTPVLSVAWLVMLSMASVAMWELLVLGVVVIVGCNVLGLLRIRKGLRTR